jgi:hypothetical protein
MWPPHTNSRAPERERRLRVWLAASMIAMVDDPPGDVDGAVRLFNRIRRRARMSASPTYGQSSPRQWRNCPRVLRPLGQLTSARHEFYKPDGADSKLHS